MRQLVLREFRTEPNVALTSDQITSLKALDPSIGISPSAQAGNYDLTPGSRVGVVRLPDLECVIRPKIPIDRLLFLISYRVDPTNWHDRVVPLDPSAGLVEGMAGAFLSVLRPVLRRGLLQGYRSEEAALATVRGRIRFDDQIRDRHGVVLPVEVRYDEFTEDIELNRRLNSALHRLERLRLRSASAQKELREQRKAFERVETLEYQPGVLPNLHFDRVNDHYRPGIGLANLILNSTSIELRHGRVGAASLLLDMNNVFEDFVVIALREALGLNEKTFPQGGHNAMRLYLDRGRRIVLKPDISWWDLERCSFVGDVKYKRIAASGVRHPDLYQLLAYTVATDLPAGLLIYAKGEDDPVIHDVVNLGKQLHVKTLDVSGTPEQILLEVDETADTIRSMRLATVEAVA